MTIIGCFFNFLIIGKEVLSTNIDEEVLTQEGVEDLELGNSKSPAMSRRDAIRTLSMGVLAAATLTAPNLARADENADKEAERKKRFDMAKEIGEYMIENRKAYTLKSTWPDHPHRWEIIALRFRGETESALFTEHWVKDANKPYSVDRSPVDRYSSILDIMYENGQNIKPV